MKPLTFAQEGLECHLTVIILIKNISLMYVWKMDKYSLYTINVKYVSSFFRRFLCTEKCREMSILDLGVLYQALWKNKKQNKFLWSIKNQKRTSILHIIEFNKILSSWMSSLATC